MAMTLKGRYLLLEIRAARRGEKFLSPVKGTVTGATGFNRDLRGKGREGSRSAGKRPHLLARNRDYDNLHKWTVHWPVRAAASRQPETFKDL